MLRVTLEVIPDERKLSKHGRIVRIIDIKEDGSGSYLEGNYKTQFYVKPGTRQEHWRHKQVLGLKYKDYTHEKLLYLALIPFLKDQEEETLTKTRNARLDSTN